MADFLKRELGCGNALGEEGPACRVRVGVFSKVAPALTSSALLCARPILSSISGTPRIPMVAKWVCIVLFASLASAILSNPANAAAILPTGDKYMYPFIDDSPTSNEGKRDYGAVFGAYGSLDDPKFNFDDRDAQFFLDFSTSALAPSGKGAANYRVVSMTLTMVVENEGGFRYDPTFDALSTYLSPASPDDSGRPLELYGVGYRSGFTRSTFTADSPFQTSPSSSVLDPKGDWNRKRNAYAIDFNSTGLARDVSNNFEEQFEVNPWAVADSPGYIDRDSNLYFPSVIQPGSLMPEGRVLRFQMNASNPFIAAYLQEALNAGRLHLMVSSLYDAQQQNSSVPRFYSLDIGVPELAPQLSAVVLVMPTTTIEKISGGFSVNFDTVVGQSYQVQYRDSLTSGSWLPLGTLRAGTGGLLSHDDSTTAMSRFYRVFVSKNQQS
jgi:hypothetical protein